MRNPIYIKRITVCIAMLCTSYTATSNEIIRMKVREYKAPCVGIAEGECLQVKYKGSKDWELFYGSIEGFDYEEGYQYSLRVKKTKRENPPADASSYTYELKRIVKKRKKKTKESAITMEKGIVDFLAAHQWNLLQIAGETQENSPVYIRFDKVKGSVSGFSGCNRFFGNFHSQDDYIKFDQLASTRMACADAHKNKLEQKFLTILRDEQLRFDVADQTLNIYKDDKLVLMFGLGPVETR